MKQSILIWFSLSVISLFGQINEFDGSMLTGKKTIVPYHISLVLDSFNQISGYSYKNNDMTKKFFIEGHFIDKTESVFFKEYSLDPSAKSCPIFFNGLIKRLINNIFVIAGSFKSRDTTICSNGHINLINYDFKNAPDAFKKLESSNKESNEELEMKKQNTLLHDVIKKDIDYKIVKGNSNTALTTDMTFLNIKIIDQATEDGDKVRIYFNNRIIADDLLLTKKGAFFKVSMSSGVNIIKILATNEGKIPQNTSKIELSDGKNKWFYLNYLENNESLSYSITKK